MTPQEAQAAYVAADDVFRDHVLSCPECDERRKYARYCPEARQLSLTAFERRQDWGAAVAAARKSTAATQERQGER